MVTNIHDEYSFIYTIQRLTITIILTVLTLRSVNTTCDSFLSDAYACFADHNFSLSFSLTGDVSAIESVLRSRPSIVHRPAHHHIDTGIRS